MDSNSIVNIVDNLISETKNLKKENSKFQNQIKILKESSKFERLLQIDNLILPEEKVKS